MTATSPSRISGPLLREWTSPDGDTWYALRPDVLALRERERERGAGCEPETLEATFERMRRMAVAGTPLIPAVAALMLEIDAEQRANGYVDGERVA